MQPETSRGSLKIIPKTYGDSGQHYCFTYPLFFGSAFVCLEILCLDKKQMDPRRYLCCNTTFLIFYEKTGILYLLIKCIKSNCIGVWEYHWTQRAFWVREYFIIRSVYSYCLQHCVIDMAQWKEKVKQSELIKDRVQRTKNNLISLSHEITFWINLNILF